jgi:sister chromatid cohesion protein PDS5
MDIDGIEEVEWMDEDALPPLAKAKILSLKVCRRRCLVHAQTESALDIAKPVLKMFLTLLENRGSTRENDPDEWVEQPNNVVFHLTNFVSPLSPRVMSRVRLQAAWSLVKLATVDKFADAIAMYFLPLVLAVQVGQACW